MYQNKLDIFEEKKVVVIKYFLPNAIFSKSGGHVGRNESLKSKGELNNR